MHGRGNFFDPRLNNREQYPVAARAGLGNTRTPDDRITPKLAALHFYQIAIPVPKPPAGTFDQARAARGQTTFSGKARCATCHVPPIFTEPGWNLHKADEIGIDSFQADRFSGPCVSHDSAPGALGDQKDPQGRLLPRWALPDAAGRREPLQSGYEPRADGGRIPGPSRVPQVALESPTRGRVLRRAGSLACAPCSIAGAGATCAAGANSLKSRPPRRAQPTQHAPAAVEAARGCLCPPVGQPRPGLPSRRTRLPPPPRASGSRRRRGRGCFAGRPSARRTFGSKFGRFGGGAPEILGRTATRSLAVSSIVSSGSRQTRVIARPGHLGRSGSPGDLKNPDFAKIAEAGLRGLTAETPEQVRSMITQALQHDAPALVDVHVSRQSSPCLRRSASSR